MQNIFDKNKAIPSSILDKNKAGAATRKHAYLLFHLQNYYANLVEEENYQKFYFSDNGMRLPTAEKPSRYVDTPIFPAEALTSTC